MLNNYPLSAQLSIATQALLRFFRQPYRLTIAMVIAVLVLGILIWIGNWSVLITYSALPSIPTASKLQFLLSGYESLWTNYTLIGAATLVLFAALTGVNMVLAGFVMTRSVQNALASGSRNMGAIIAAAIGAGCAACGTSFLTPLLAGVGAVTAITIVEIVGVVANLAGLALLLYSIFYLSLQTHVYMASE